MKPVSYMLGMRSTSSAIATNASGTSVAFCFSSELITKMQATGWPKVSCSETPTFCKKSC